MFVLRNLAPTAQEIDSIREGNLREAHEKILEKEVKKITGGGDSSSFESVNSVGERGRQPQARDHQGFGAGEGALDPLHDRPLWITWRWGRFLWPRQSLMVAPKSTMPAG